MKPSPWPHALAEALAVVVVVVAEEGMETEEDEADSKSRHVVHSMNGAACKNANCAVFFTKVKIIERKGYGENL